MLDKIKNYRYHLNNAYFDSPLKFGDTQLWQIGRLYCSPSTVIGLHRHPLLFELTVATSGNGVVYTDGVPQHVEAGDIYLSFPYEAHKIESDAKEPLRYDFIAFMTDNQELLEALNRIRDEYGDPRKRLFRDEGITGLIGDALCEIETPDIYSEKMLEHIFSRIIIRIIRNFSNSSTEKKKSASDAEALCYQAMYYIDTHVLSIKNLSDVSDAVSYNYSYLSDLFRRTTGQKLSDYYRSRKLEAAKQFLSDGGTVTKISELLGYSSVYAFSRAFKEKYGIPPNRYRKKK